MKQQQKARSLITVDESEVFEESKFEEDLDVNLDDLQHAMTRHGASYWKYGKLSAIAVRLHERATLAYEIAKREHQSLEATTNEFYRKQLLVASQDGSFKVTEKLIDSKVLQDEQYLGSQRGLDGLKEELVELEFTVGILSLAEKIFSKRTDILTTLGYLAQSEQKSGGMQVMSSKATARADVDQLKREASGVRRRKVIS